jgi:hypothetical protein
MHLLTPEPSAAAALPLPPRLRELLDSIPDRALAGRLARVWSAAREALDEVERLALAPAGLDEPGADPAHLSLWESAAPALRDTRVALHRLLARVHADFPTAPHEELDWSDGAPIVRALPAQQAALVLRLCAGRLETRAEDLRELLLHADNDDGLAQQLREVHRALRAELRELVLQSAAAFAAPGEPRDALLTSGPRGGVRLLRALPGADAD